METFAIIFSFVSVAVLRANPRTGLKWKNPGF
jgi:hypothetical protein